MTDTAPDGWRELDALQTLARGANLKLMRSPLSDLIAALGLGGYKFCIAAPEEGAFRILAVIAGGDLNASPDGFGDALIGPSDPILWESYRSATPVSWTPYFRDQRLMEASSVSQLAAKGVTAGASIPILSRNQTRRASLCVSGGAGEAPEALDLRLISFWPVLRLAGLALFEAGMAEVAARADRRLTPSETAVLSALSEGMRIKDVAASLGKSERTIRNQLESARARIGAATTIEAVVRWERRARAGL
ncbi:MAG: LuxR C-terminal-related transcriptional regulator [Pseudomonadota bacterium]